MPIPFTVLTLAYWLHMIATVLWFGGICSLTLLIFPAAKKSLDASAYAALLEKIQKRLDPLGWFCLAILVATGLVQMNANPNYQGLLAINNRWASAILVKHLLFLLMTGLSVYMSWVLLPKLRQLALQRNRLAVEVFSARLSDLNRKEDLILKLNLILGIVVLALTAFARST